MPRIWYLTLIFVLVMPCVMSIQINETINSTLNNTLNKTEGNNTLENNTNQTGLKLEIILSPNIFIGVIYDNLFKITNLNHTKDDPVLIIVKYNITKNNTLFSEDYFNKTLTYYATSGTGRLFLEETGNYTLCGTILNTTVSACNEIAVINPLYMPCYIEFNLSTDKSIYENGEGVKIKNSIGNTTFPYIIEYWVEDLFGDIIKNRQSTSNINIKSFTPKVKEKDAVFIIKNKLVFVGCNNSNSAIANEKIAVFKNLDYEEEKEEERKTAEKGATKTTIQEKKNSTSKKNESSKNEKKAKIVSFYTRNKKYNQSVNLYANIQATKDYDIILVINGSEQKIGFNGSNNLKFSVEPKEGLNLFVLQLRKNGKVVDTKSLNVTLEGGKDVSVNKKAVLLEKRNETAKVSANKKLVSIDNASAALDSLTSFTGNVIYESPNAKAQKFIPYFLLALCTLVVVGLVLLKRR